MRTPFRTRHGFTLIEMLAVMFLLSVVTGIMVLLLKDTMDVESAQRESFDGMLRITALADQFRADVAEAKDTRPKWRDYAADAHTLILQMPSGGQVVYSRHDGSLRRLAFENQKETQRELPVAGDQADIEFVRDPGNPKVIRLRIYALRREVRLPGQTLEIAAALGGDWR